MATKQNIELLENSIAAFKILDIKEKSEKEIEEKPIFKDFNKSIDKLDYLKDLSMHYAYSVHNNAVLGMTNVFKDVFTLLEKNSQNTDYSENFIKTLNDFLEETKEYEPSFVAAAVVEKGLLKEKKLKEEYARDIKFLKDETVKTIRTVKAEAYEIIKEMKVIASKIEAGKEGGSSEEKEPKYRWKFLRDESAASQEKEVKLWVPLIIATSILLITVSGIVYVVIRAFFL